MKTLLIPSAFDRESIVVAETALQAIEGDVRLLFVHLFRMPDGVHDLLFSSYRKADYKYVTDRFRRDAEELRDQYSYKLKEVKWDFFYGNTMALFKNYLQYYDVRAIVYSESLGVRELNKNSMDILAIARKSGCRMVDIDGVGEPTLISSQMLKI